MKKTRSQSLSVMMRYGFEVKAWLNRLGTKALHTHVDKEDKKKLSDLEGVPRLG